VTQSLSSFSGMEIFLLTCAVIGGFFVLVKLVIQFIGGEMDTDIGIDGDVGGDIGHSDSDAGFRVLSLHGLSAFFMMFGLVGFALFRQSHAGAAVSIAGAAAAGMASVWIIGRIFRLASRLQSSGTLKTADAVGCTGIVYLTIREGGTGRVSINFRNRLREFNAIEKNGAQLPTGTTIRVVDVRANILVVEAEE